MIQQQRFGGNMIGTPLQLVREFGVTSLGRGITMTGVLNSIKYKYDL
jgi:hypothetical protein